MNGILFEKLPSSVSIGGREFVINTDFRCMAAFENELLKCKGTRNVKQRAEVFGKALSSFYINNIPANVNEAVNMMWWFYRCGEDITQNKNRAGISRRNERLYDYEIDGERIAAAFRSQYNIDLTNEKLHWWLFKSYFCGLSSECEFVKVMCYRGIDLKDIKNGKERARYKRLKEHYALPAVHFAPMTKEERDRAYMQRLKGN